MDQQANKQIQEFRNKFFVIIFQLYQKETMSTYSQQFICKQ